MSAVQCHSSSRILSPEIDTVCFGQFEFSASSWVGDVGSFDWRDVASPVMEREAFVALYQGLYDALGYFSVVFYV